MYSEDESSCSCASTAKLSEFELKNTEPTDTSKETVVPPAPLQTLMRFGRPMKQKDVLALCPECTLMCANLWECERCGAEFQEDVKLLPSTHLKENFVPKFVKEEKEVDNLDKDVERSVTGVRKEESFPVNSEKDSSKKILPLMSINTEKLIEKSSSSIPETTELRGAEKSLNTTNMCQKNFDSSGRNESSSQCSKNSVLRSDTIENIEVRIRIFPQTIPKTVHKLQSHYARQKPYTSAKCKLDTMVNISDTVVEETLVNDFPKILRLIRLQLCGLKSILGDKRYSENVENVIFGGPCSLQVVEKVLSRLTLVTGVRFGQDSLISDENDDWKMNLEGLVNKSMRVFEVTFDRKEYRNKTENQKSHIRERILTVLKLAAECYPNLDECNVTVPLIDEVDQAVDSLARKFGSKGIKNTNYEKKLIHYTVNEVNDGGRTRNKKSNMRGEVDKDKKAQAIKSSSEKRKSSSETCTKEELKRLRNKRRHVEVVCLSSDEERGPKTKIVMQDPLKISSKDPLCVTNNGSANTVSDHPHLKIAATPEQVIEKMENGDIRNGVGAFTHFKCASVRVGDYRCTQSQNSPESALKLYVSRIGLYFMIPHSLQETKIVKIGIPAEMVTKITIVVNFQFCMPCIIVQTSFPFDAWIQNVLQLNLSSNEGNYYSPVNGGQCQKNIIFYEASMGSEVSVDLLKRIFHSKVQEVDYDAAKLMIDTFKCHGHTFIAPAKDNQD